MVAINKLELQLQLLRRSHHKQWHTPDRNQDMAKNALNQRKELLSKSLNKDIKKRTIKAIIRSVALYMQIKPGHRPTRKKISGDWRLVRCGCGGGGWKRSV